MDAAKAIATFRRYAKVYPQEEVAAAVTQLRLQFREAKQNKKNTLIFPVIGARYVSNDGVLELVGGERVKNDRGEELRFDVKTMTRGNANTDPKSRKTRVAINWVPGISV